MIKPHERLSNPLQESYEVNKYGRVHRSVFFALRQAGYADWPSMEKALDTLSGMGLMPDRLRLVYIPAEDVEGLHAIIEHGVMFDQMGI
jgi:hypothetical protein